MNGYESQIEILMRDLLKSLQQEEKSVMIKKDKSLIKASLDKVDCYYLVTFEDVSNLKVIE